MNSVIIRAIKARLNALSQQEKESNPPQVVLLGEKARLGKYRTMLDRGLAPTLTGVVWCGAIQVLSVYTRTSSLSPFPNNPNSKN